MTKVLMQALAILHTHTHRRKRRRGLQCNKVMLLYHLTKALDSVGLFARVGKMLGYEANYTIE